MNTKTIEDCSISILSIFPIGITATDNNILNKIQEGCHTLAEKTPWIQLLPQCNHECGGNISTGALKCSCFDVYDLFINETANQHVRRYYLGTTHGRWCDKVIRIDLFLKVLTNKKLGIFNINVSCKNFEIEQIIALRHLLENGMSINPATLPKYLAKEESSNVSNMTGGVLAAIFNLYKDSICNLIRKKLITKKNEPDPLVANIARYKSVYNLQILIEIRSIMDLKENTTSAHEWAMAHCQEVYGLITGDEGIGFIPNELCQERLKLHWSSRNFVDVIAFGKNVLVLNAKTTSTNGLDYMEFQRQWKLLYNGSENRMKYFTTRPCMAGLDHGILQAVEKNMVVRYLYDFINNQTKSNSQNLNKQRQKLLSFISATSSPIDEINELFDIISTASGTNKSIDLVRTKLNIQSEEININYQNKNNGIILMLTILSLATAICSIHHGTILINSTPWYKDLGGILTLLLVITIITIGVTKMIEKSQRINK